MFDEAMVDRVAREVYGEERVNRVGAHCRNVTLAFLDAASKTHAVIPQEKWQTAISLLAEVCDTIFRPQTCGDAKGKCGVCTSDCSIRQLWDGVEDFLRGVSLDV